MIIFQNLEWGDLMKEILAKVNHSVEHLSILFELFEEEANFLETEKKDHELYVENLRKFEEISNHNNYQDLLYSAKGRQMILADVIEYSFLGRIYYGLTNREEKSNFIKAILYYVNMLMSLESLTVSDNLRTKFLEKLKGSIPAIEDEPLFPELEAFRGKIGLPRSITQGSRKLNRYFDSLLPKTAGGLWHELLVYIFILRSNLGFIIPLLLTQRFLSLDDHLVPPDFFVLTKDKHLYGIEVGRKKEIQSGSFSLRTAIPTASVDTENSRTSDRCPICLRWIQFCPYVIENYSDIDFTITNSEIRCLNTCDKFTNEEINIGVCPYTKYSRNRTTRDPRGMHEFANGYHYHYQCVLSKLDEQTKQIVINSNDSVALKSHFPYYQGLEELRE
jgi:hypothetical protein